MSACADKERVSNTNASSQESFRYEVPWPEDDTLSQNVDPITLGRDGQLSYQGRSISYDDVPRIQMQIEENGKVPLINQLDEDAPFRVPLLVEERTPFNLATSQLKEVYVISQFRLVGLRQFRKFQRTERSMADMDFLGELSPYELPVVIRYSPTSSRCEVAVAGQAVDDIQAFDAAFEKLDFLVQREGGVDAILADEDRLQSLTVRMQSQPSTPWRCIAGPLFAVWRAGWPHVSFEVIDN